MSKQSSIDFILNAFNLLSDSDFKSWMLNNYDVIKAMHKKEIIDARNNGFMQSAEGWNGEYGLSDFSCLTKEIQSEQYYKETFGDEEVL